VVNGQREITHYFVAAVGLAAIETNVSSVENGLRAMEEWSATTIRENA